MNREAFSSRARRLAQVGICVQFLALIRTLAEFFRLQHVEEATLRIGTVAPYVGAGLLGAVLTWVAVLCYFAGRDRAAHVVVGTTISSAPCQKDRDDRANLTRRFRLLASEFATQHRAEYEIMEISLKTV